jgi:hypothetical protein
MTSSKAGRKTATPSDNENDTCDKFHDSLTLFLGSFFMTFSALYACLSLNASLCLCVCVCLCVFRSESSAVNQADDADGSIKCSV